MSDSTPQVPWRRILFQAGTKLMDASRDDRTDPLYAMKAAKATLELMISELEGMESQSDGVRKS